MRETNFLYDFKPSTMAEIEKLKLAQQGLDLEPPNRWSDIRDDLLRAHEYVQIMVERIAVQSTVVGAMTEAGVDFSFPYVWGEQDMNDPHFIAAVQKAGVRPPPVTEKEKLRERRDPYMVNARKYIALAWKQYAELEKPDVDEAWREASSAENEDNALLLANRDVAHRYIWGKIGKQIIQYVTEGVGGESPTYERNLLWVGREAVHASTRDLIEANDPRLLSPKVIKLAKASDKRRKTALAKQSAKRLSEKNKAVA